MSYDHFDPVEELYKRTDDKLSAARFYLMSCGLGAPAPFSGRSAMIKSYEKIEEEEEKERCLEALIELAQRDPIIWTILDDYANSLLLDALPLPEALSRFKGKVCVEELRKPGRIPENYRRDFAFCIAVERLSQVFEIGRTENEVTRSGNSACQFVADAAEEILNKPFSYEGVRKAYDRYSSRMKGLPLPLLNMYFNASEPLKPVE